MFAQDLILILAGSGDAANFDGFTDVILTLNDEVSFSTRFNGVSMAVTVPMTAVRGLVAREYGVGISFAHDEALRFQPECHYPCSSLAASAAK